MLLKFVLLFVAAMVAMASLRLWWQRDAFEPGSINDKKVLITGASSGIGEQIAYQYAKLGARLVITARRVHLLEKVARRCLELGARQVESIPADMALAPDRSRVIDAAGKLLGGLDHLILNHADMTTALWTGAPENLNTLSNTMNVNFLSYVDLASQALPMLEASRGGIGVVSSILGKTHQAGASAYCSSKFALQGFFASLRQELEFRGTGVSVTLCVLALINVDTSMVNLKKAFPNSDTSEAASSTETAEAIMQGVATATPEIYFPAWTYVLVKVQSFFPDYLKGYIVRL